MKYRTSIALLAATTAFSTAAHADLSNVLGVTHIDGKYYETSGDYLNEGADQVLGTGSKVIKLEMDHYTNTKYQWNSTWPNSFSSLTSMAQLPYFQSVFSKPFSTYILTAYSPNVGDYEHYWNRGTTDPAGITPARQAQETTSFYNLTKYLMQTYKGSSKTFILSHWEGDYAMRPSGQTFDTTIDPTQASIDGMVAWLNARQAGINQAKADVLKADPSNDVKVFGATEASLGNLAVQGRPGVVNSVLPRTDVDYLEYSAWDSQKNIGSFSTAVDYMASKLPASAINGQSPRSVIVGEFGTKENLEGTAQVNTTINNVLSTVAAKNMPYAVYWEVMDNELNGTATAPVPATAAGDSQVHGLWMVKPDGTASTAWHQYRGRIATSDSTRATTGFTSGLTKVYADAFTTSGTNLGPNWTTSNWGGAISIQQSSGLLQMKILNASATPWGEARLNLTQTIGRGLKPGEYAEFKLRRQNANGQVGVGLFGDASGLVHAGSGAGSSASALQIWSGNQWNPISFATDGSHPTTNWDTSHTMGVRLDSADGNFATVSYYLDGAYLASWLYKTSATTLDTIALFSQSGTTNAGFEFDNLNVFASALPGDVNMDGKINTADFTAMASNFNKGNGAVWMQGDFNNDGIVNALDFNVLASRFGQSMSAPALGQVVPEPSAIIMLSLAVCTLATRRRR